MVLTEQPETPHRFGPTTDHVARWWSLGFFSEVEVVTASINFGIGGTGSIANTTKPLAGQKDAFADFKASLVGKNQQELVNILASKNTGIPRQGIEAGIVLSMLGTQVKSKGAMSPAGRDLIKSAAAWLQGNPKAGIVLAALQDAVKG
jgi:hypothetical protein